MADKKERGVKFLQRRLQKKGKNRPEGVTVVEKKEEPKSEKEHKSGPGTLFQQPLRVVGVQDNVTKNDDIIKAIDMFASTLKKSLLLT